MGDRSIIMSKVSRQWPKPPPELRARYQMRCGESLVCLDLSPHKGKSETRNWKVAFVWERLRPRLGSYKIAQSRRSCGKSCGKAQSTNQPSQHNFRLKSAPNLNAWCMTQRRNTTMGLPAVVMFCPHCAFWLQRSQLARETNRKSGKP